MDPRYKDLFIDNCTLLYSNNNEVAVYFSKAYEIGFGVEKNLNKAILILKQCGNYRWALQRLLTIYKENHIFEHDYFSTALDLHNCGDINGSVNAALCYSYGIGTEKNPSKALSILNNIKDKSEWANNVYFQIVLREGLLDNLNIDDGILFINKDKIDCIVNGSVINNNIVFSIDCSINDNFIFDIYCNDVLLFKKEIHSNTISIAPTSSGVYFCIVKWKNNSSYIVAESLPIIYPPQQIQSPPIHIPFYTLNYPYSDIAVVLSWNIHDYSSYNGFDIKRMHSGNKWIEILNSGSFDKNGSSFSGLGVIQNQFVYGINNLKSKSSKILSESIGNYFYVIVSNNKVSIGTDYFGLSKIFYYESPSISIYSNRYQLLLLLMNKMGIELNVDWKLLSSMFFTDFGFLCDQPITNDMMCDGTKIIDIGKSVQIVNGKTYVISNSIDDQTDVVDYSKAVSDAASELNNNMNAVLNSGLFDKYIIDITGGIDSRLSLTIFNNNNDNNIAFVDTSGSNDKDLKIASTIAETLGYNYNSKYMSYRSRSGGFGMSNLGGLDVGAYLDLALSINMGWFDPSFPPTISFGNNVLHITGHCGEVSTRPYMREKFFKTSLLDTDTPESFVDRVLASYSNKLSTKNEYAIQSMRSYLIDALSKCWTNDKNIACECILLEFRQRFHFDFSSAGSYSTPTWSPLMSPKCYKLMKNSSYNSYRFVFDLLHYLNSSLDNIAFDSDIENIGRNVILRDHLLFNPSNYNMPSVLSKDYMNSKAKSDVIKLTIHGNDVPKLNESVLFDFMIERCHIMLNYIKDTCVSGDISFLYDYFERLTSKDGIAGLSKEYTKKRLISFYKKIGLLYYIVELSNDEEPVIKKYDSLVIDD